MRFVLAVVLATTAGSLFQAALPAKAQIADFKCEFFFTGQANIPNPVLRYMSKYSDASAEGCTNPSGELVFYRTVTEVSVGSWGVCRFAKYTRVADARELSPPLPPDGEVYMRLSQSDCPRQDDPQYIPADGISDGLFTALSNFVQNVSSSEQEFDSGFALKDQSSEQDRLIYNRMREEIVRGPTRFEIKTIRLEQSIYVPSVQAYQVTLFEKPFCGNYWELLVDLTPSGLKAVAFEGGRVISDFQPDPSCSKLNR